MLNTNRMSPKVCCFTRDARQPTPSTTSIRRFNQCIRQPQPVITYCQYASQTTQNQPLANASPARSSASSRFMAAPVQFPPLSLVTIHGLTSPQGAPLNQRHAVILSHNDATARIQLVVLPQSPTHLAQNRAIKPANLRPSEPPPCGSPPYQAYVALLQTVAARRFQTGCDFAASQHAFDCLFALPGYQPTLGERATYANAFREMGRPRRAAEMLEDVLREAVLTRSSNENYFRYDLGAAYLNAGMLGSALEATMAIDAARSADEAHRQIKVDLLNMLCAELKYVSDPREEDACRALLQEQPDDGTALWNLGALLCRTGKTAEGVEAYRRAVQVGTGLTDEQREKINRDREIGELELQGKFDGQKVVRVLAGGQVLTVPSAVEFHAASATGVASQIVRSRSSQADVEGGECEVASQDTEDTARVDDENDESAGSPR